ncbi:hypothetical protein [Nocardia sp. CA-145437]|uniref:hypothetical protein n=1 Tax=Nocardia sp. CA-145437 TaxID=3239980 RepID=UPI003D99E450
MPGLGHQLQQARASLAEMGEHGMPELVQIPPGPRPVDGGRGVEQVTGLVVGQPGQR